MKNELILVSVIQLNLVKYKRGMKDVKRRTKKMFCLVFMTVQSKSKVFQKKITS